MVEIRLLAAIGRGRLKEALRIAEVQPFVVFYTLDGLVLKGFSDALPAGIGPMVRVHLYETG